MSRAGQWSGVCDEEIRATYVRGKRKVRDDGAARRGASMMDYW